MQIVTSAPVQDQQNQQHQQLQPPQGNDQMAELQDVPLEMMQAPFFKSRPREADFGTCLALWTRMQNLFARLHNNGMLHTVLANCTGGRGEEFCFLTYFRPDYIDLEDWMIRRFMEEARLMLEQTDPPTDEVQRQGAEHLLADRPIDAGTAPFLGYPTRSRTTKKKSDSQNA